VVYFLLASAAVTGIWVLAHSQCPGQDNVSGIFANGGPAEESPGAGGDCASWVLPLLRWGRYCVSWAPRCVEFFRSLFRSSPKAVPPNPDSASEHEDKESEHEDLVADDPLGRAPGHGDFFTGRAPGHGDFFAERAPLTRQRLLLASLPQFRVPRELDAAVPAERDIE
jgi:hypothetical protein